MCRRRNFNFVPCYDSPTALVRFTAIVSVKRLRMCVMDLHITRLDEIKVSCNIIIRCIISTALPLFQSLEKGTGKKMVQCDLVFSRFSERTYFL